MHKDGYNAFEIFDEWPADRLMHCMSHAQSISHEAMDNDEASATYALDQMDNLYTIERICENKA